MAGKLVRTALRSSLNQVRHVRPVRPRDATGATEEVYRQLERDFGMLAPPISLHSPAPANMVAAWVMLRESLVVTTTVPRAMKEAVAVGVSIGNACPYCVEVHSAALGALVGSHARALSVGDLTGIADRELAEVATWGRDSGLRDTAHPRPFPDTYAPQLVGVACAFHYLNRVVHVFLGDSPLPPRVPLGARAAADRFLGRFMRPALLRRVPPGESTALLPPTAPALEPAWAAGEPPLAAAFGRAAATIDAAAERSVSPAVRGLVIAQLLDWDGRPPGLSRAWVDGPVAALPAADRPAARLALLVSKAVYQVDDDVVAAYRGERPADADLVELVSWASLAAARQVGGWLDQPPRAGIPPSEEAPFSR